MKILIDSVFTNKSIKRCSTHYSFQTIAKYLVENIADAVVYYVLPANNGEGEHFSIDLAFQHERIVYVYHPCFKDRYKEYYYLKREWIDDFGFWGDAFDWDVMLTVRSTMVPQMRVMSEKGIHRFSRKIIIYDILPMFDFKKTVHISGDLRMQTVSSYMNADLTVVHTGHELTGVKEACRELLSPASTARLMGKCFAKYIAPVVDKEYPPTKRDWFINEKQFKLVYTQRLDATERRPELVFSSLMYAFVTESNIKTEIYTNTAVGLAEGEFKTPDEGLFSRIEMTMPQREKFYENLKKAHCFVSFAIEEGLPLGLFEAICHGVIGVVCRKPWSSDMFGPKYPWLFNSMEECVGMVKWINENREKAYDMFLEWYLGWFRPTHDVRGDFLRYCGNQIIEWDRAESETIRKGYEEYEEKELRMSTIIYNMAKNDGLSGQYDLFELICMAGNKKLIRTNFEKVDNLDAFSIPISRNRSFRKTYQELKYVFGWKDAPGKGHILISE